MRKILATAALATLALGAVAVPASAGGINGSGTLICGGTGSTKTKPGLGSGGGTLASTTSVKATLTSCSGTGDGATVASGSAKGGSSSATNGCGDLAGPGTTNMSITVKWKGSAKLNPTTVNFATLTGDASGATLAFTLSGGTVSGSFAGSTPLSVGTTTMDVATYLAGCGSKKGVTGFTLSSIAASFS